MAVNIVSALISTPSTVSPGEQATLSVTLSSDAPPETATLAYSLTDPAYTFAATSSAVLTTQALVGASTPTSTPYALNGPAGPASVQIDLAVAPNNPPSQSATTVVIRGSGMFGRLMRMFGFEP